MMALGRGPDLGRKCRIRPDERRLKIPSRKGVLDALTYRLFADTTVRAPDGQFPLGRTQWRIWRQLLARFHISGEADIMARGAPLSRFDAR